MILEKNILLIYGIIKLRFILHHVIIYEYEIKIIDVFSNIRKNHMYSYIKFIIFQKKKLCNYL